MAATTLRPRSRFVSTLIVIGVLYFVGVFIPTYTEPYVDFRFGSRGFDWSKLAQKYPVAELKPLPAGSPKELPKVQHDFSADGQPTRVQREVTANRRVVVKKAFLKSWKSYKRLAWMHDELTPVSGESSDNFGGWAATLVDALDTLWIMDMRDEFEDAVAAVAAIDWNHTNDTAVNFFETTIRHLGGLLSAYDLSQERVLLKKAVELGDMLYAAFDTPNRMPPFWLDFEKAKTGELVAGSHDPSASVASAGLEFTRLAQLSGEDKYYDAIDRVTRLLERKQNETRLPGMWPTWLDMRDERFEIDRHFTIGALADSLYEYFPKMHAILGGLEPVYEKLYRGAMRAVGEHMVFRPMLPGQEDILFTGDIRISEKWGPRLLPEAQHLSCFVGGMYGLGGKFFDIPEHVEMGEKLARGCAWAYSAFPTGIMPENLELFPCPSREPCPWNETIWRTEGNTHLPRGVEDSSDRRYLLRPEAIESIFIMYRITGNTEYQDMAWKMFQSIRKATETDLAFSAIQDVSTEEATTKLDSMESFWMAETLKYLYLIFSPPDLISLDEFVLNTEAHPLKRP